MSCKTTLNTLSWEQRKLINKDLKIKVEAVIGPHKYVYPYELENEYLYLPFSYAYEKNGPVKCKRPLRTDFPAMTAKFEGSLRSEQNEVRREVLTTLSKTGSVIVSAYPGFGKCLGINTKILLYDGRVKFVQDITTSDVLMGDDSTPRQVLSTCRGQERMYRISSNYGNEFTANESHILSLSLNGKCIDISIKNYLYLPVNIQEHLLYKKTEVDFAPVPVTDAYGTGFSLLLPFEYTRNSKSVRIRLLCGILDAVGVYEANKRVISINEKNCKLFNIQELVFLTGSLGIGIDVFNNGIEIFGQYVHNLPFRVLDINQCKSYPLNCHFYVNEIEDRDYYGFVIDGNRRFVLGDFTVTHNTIGAIEMSCNIGFKTLIIVNKIVLIKQWEESIRDFSPSASIQKLTSKSQIVKETDFYIVNAINVSKLGRDTLTHVGTVIVDEAHLIMAETLSRSLGYVFPRYLIGLTATPYRPDGLNVLLDLYFGKTKIIRKLVREHVVFKIKTGFTPSVELTKNGRINWGVILDEQARDVERNELIVKIVRTYKMRTFLILVKRVCQGEFLVSRFQECGEDVTSLIGTQQEFKTSSRILVGTVQKVGVGFDHPRLDTLLLAADVKEYFIQYLGRCMRTKEHKPIIFDLVDNNKILERHFATRKAIYLEHGGKISTLNPNSLT